MVCFGNDNLVFNINSRRQEELIQQSFVKIVHGQGFFNAIHYYLRVIFHLDLERLFEALDIFAGILVNRNDFHRVSSQGNGEHFLWAWIAHIKNQALGLIPICEVKFHFSIRSRKCFSVNGSIQLGFVQQNLLFVQNLILAHQFQAENKWKLGAFGNK